MSTVANSSAQVLKLNSRREVAERTVAFEFTKPLGFEFKAGQFAEITWIDPPETDAEGNARAFSIASAPYEDRLMFYDAPARYRLQTGATEDADWKCCESRRAFRRPHAP
jgi:hypothetical protein